MRIEILTLLIIGMLQGCHTNGSDTCRMIDEAAVIPPGRALKIMPLGDSFTQGSSQEGDDYGGYRHKLFDLLTASGVQFDFVGSQTSGDFPDSEHEGHGGWVCDYSICTSFPDWAVKDWGLMQHIRQWQKESEPDVVLLFAGINDMHSGFNVSPADCAGAQSALIDTLIHYNPDIIVFVSKHRVSGGEKNIRLNECLADIVSQKQQNGRSVYLTDIFKGFDASLHLDGSLHPTREGYDIIAKNWYVTIKYFLSGVQ